MTGWERKAEDRPRVLLSASSVSGCGAAIISAMMRICGRNSSDRLNQTIFSRETTETKKRESDGWVRRGRRTRSKASNLKSAFVACAGDLHSIRSEQRGRSHTLALTAALLEPHISTPAGTRPQRRREGLPPSSRVSIPRWRWRRRPSKAQTALPRKAMLFPKRLSTPSGGQSSLSLAYEITGLSKEATDRHPTFRTQTSDPPSNGRSQLWFAHCKKSTVEAAAQPQPQT